MTALRTVNSVPDSSWHSYLIRHSNMSFLQICLVYATKKKKTLPEQLDPRSNNGQNLSFIITHACKSLSAHWWPSICEVCDVKICWRFCSSALGDRKDLENEEQTSALGRRTKERGISTALRPVLRLLRPVLRPLPVLPPTDCLLCALLTDCVDINLSKEEGWRKKMKKMNSFDSILLFSEIFTSSGQSLSKPFVWGSSADRGRQCVCVWGEGGREREKGRKGTQQRPYVQCDPHYSQLGQPSMEWSCW